MDTTIAQLVLGELFPALEALETQNAAILQFLKERGIANDKDLAPFLEQAANASSVRWRATRLRMDHVLSTAAKSKEAPQGEPRAATEASNKDQKPVQESHEPRKDSQEHEQRAKSKADSKAEGDRATGQQKDDEKRGPGEAKHEKPAGKDAA